MSAQIIMRAAAAVKEPTQTMVDPAAVATDDSDPFALGGRSGQTATEEASESTGNSGSCTVGIASPAGIDPADLYEEAAMPETHAVIFQDDRRIPAINDPIIAQFAMRNRVAVDLNATSDEKFVNEEEKAALTLLAGEGWLAVLAHEQFEAEELWGDTPANDPSWDRMGDDCKRLMWLVVACPAKTIGGVAWRLREIDMIVQEESGVSEWLRRAVRQAFADALALAVLQRDPV
jgi:hypothetical protein